MVAMCLIYADKRGHSQLVLAQQQEWHLAYKRYCASDHQQDFCPL